MRSTITKIFCILAIIICKFVNIFGTTKLPRIQLEQHRIFLEYERNRGPGFQCNLQSTKVDQNWNDLPAASKYHDQLKTPCSVPLSIDMTSFGYSVLILCLFRDEIEKGLFKKDSQINIMGQDFESPGKLYEEVQAVMGYILNDQYSLVTGYIINKNFYGSLRFFDPIRLYHVVFYIEPQANAQLYDSLGSGRKRKRRDNSQSSPSCIFEYVSQTNKNDPPTAQNFDDTSQSKARKKRQTNQTNSEDEDVDTFKFKNGMTKHNIFDLRRQDTFLCELCIWIQPNFAQKFSLGGSVQHGVAEIIDLIQLLNWIFRTLDFDQDGSPENIGFIIKHIVVNDDIRVTRTGSKEKHPGRPGTSESYLSSTNMQTITTKSSLSLAKKHMSAVFKSCCASIGFIYHNMAPTLSTTNLRGICTNKNIAVVSGVSHSNKIAKYDVFRNLMHAIGHLFGSHHDDVTNLHCNDMNRHTFSNPFLMHPVQQLNNGLRRNSLRMSSCSKDHITQFLSSNGIFCLVQINQPFCGNGILEEGEECDCGALWQCHLEEECCGERDTVSGCKLTNKNKPQCLLKPRVW